MPLTIYIARHGQDEDNANGILNGRRDKPLTKLGKKQAEELGNRIVSEGVHINGIYCSPLMRARETANIVRDIVGLSKPPTSLSELIERDYGIMTGKSVVEREAMYGPTVIRSEAGIYKTDQEGAETFPELLSRAHEALDIIQRENHNGNILVVCHGEIGKMLYAAARNMPWRDVLQEFYFVNGMLVKV